MSWSLGVEVSFYALLPVFSRALALAVRRLRRANATRAQLMIIGALGAGSLAMRVLLAGSFAGMVPNRAVVAATALPALMDWFVIGMAFAVLAADWETGGSCWRWLASLARRPCRCWLIALSCAAAGAPFQHGDLFPTLYGPLTHVAIGLAAALLVLPAIAGGLIPAGPIRLLTHPVAGWFGTISYGVYLWHVPVLYVLRGPLAIPHRTIGVPGLLVLLAAVAAGATALAAASWYLVERPIQRAYRTARPRGTLRPSGLGALNDSATASANWSD